MNNLPEWVEENKIQIGLGLLGILLIGVGVWQSIDKQMSQDSEIEIIDDSETDSNTHKIVVDVSGAVENPGVYEFDSGARINDALMRAGGLSANADRGYVSRGVNLAEEMMDGVKIYIPFKDEPLSNGVKSDSSDVYGAKTVSVNHASLSELDSLWGIGESRAKLIIDNRPYSSLEELESKASIPSNVLEANEGKISL